MCLFTHFAAGALAGGLTGSVGWGAAAGLASHAVLDVLPHYDHPDWRLELAGGVAALLLLLLMPFASAAAIVGGIAGMLPDLENLFQKLGRLGRDRFVFPTHTGLLRHGPRRGPRNLVVQAAIFVACFVALGVARPSAAAAAEADTPPAATAPAAEMAMPVVRVLSQGADRTVVRIDFPVQSAPADWRTLDPAAVRYALPPVIDDLDDGIGGQLRLSAPELRLSLAVPTRALPQVTVTDVRWWREPDAGVDPAALVVTGAPAVYRKVPLAGLKVALAAEGGVLAGLTLECRHAATAPFDARLALAAKSASLATPEAAAALVPAGVANGDLFTALAEGAREQSLAAAATKAAAFDPFNTTGHWVTLRLTTTGLYRLTGQQLAGYGVPVGDVDPAKLRLYRGGSLALEMDPEYPDSLQADRTGLHEVAISVVDGGDGEWNLDDEIRFYGVATSAWLDRFQPGAGRLEHYDHPYAAEAVYWLTWENDATASPLPGAPRRVPVVQAPALGGQAVDTARLRLHLEQQYADAMGVVADNWTWDSSIFSSHTDQFTVRTPVAGSTTQFVADVRGMYDLYSAGFVFTAKAWLNGDQAQAGTTTITYSTQNDSLRVRVGGESTALVGGSNTFTVLNASAAQANRRALALDSFDVLYWTALALDPAFGQLEFAHWGDQVAAPATATDLRLAVPTGITPVVWDVSRPDSARILVGTPGTGLVTLGVVRDPGADLHCVASVPAGLLAVDGGSRLLPVSLLDDDGNVDYVVVAASAMAVPGQNLAAFRGAVLPGVASPRSRAVTAEAIYNNYSGGQKDPLAIRNYLRSVYEKGGQRLKAVCLVGKASHDYRNYRGVVPLVDLYDLVPTVVRNYFPIFPVALNRQTPFASDDALVSFDTAPVSVIDRYDLDLPDVACGRLPALDATQAHAMVDRAIEQAVTPAEGPWRNSILLTADDVNRPSSGQVPVFGEDTHTREAEDINANYLPASVDVTKIYGVDYPFPPSSNVKPAARAAINAALNAGTTLYYYVGHGAEDNLADEQIFQSRDIANLGNGGRRPLFVAFSCDVGVFDSPSRLSMAEQFVSYTAGGAAGTICASQVSWSTDNDAITEAFFRNLFPSRHVDAGRSVGEALRLAKGQMGSLDYRANSQRYNLMGDPAMRLPHPVDDLVLAPASLDTLRAGARQVVVLAAAGKAALAAGDRYRLRVEESSTSRSYQNTPFGGTATWIEGGGAVFDGEGDVGTGDLVVPFKVPAQVRYGDNGRVRLLIEGADGAHAAVKVVPAVRGSLGAIDDVRGPLIDLAFADGRHRVHPGDPLVASLVDTSGIAMLGTSPGNSLMLELDDSGRMTDVTSAFAYDPNSYTSGGLVYPLPQDLASGVHKAALHASDALGNVGSDTLSFEIVPSDVVGIEDVTVFPNPTAGPCRLLCELSDPMAVQWDIYTLAGHRLRTLHAEPAEAGPCILDWDGRDAQGDEIANGTYLFVLRGEGASVDGRVITKTGKLVIMR